jgi:glycosyltransferase involved in cell wall biosynthesis
MAACAILNIPTVIAFQLVTEELSLGTVQFKLYHWARGRNQKWIAISENNRELLIKFFRVSKRDIALIYNGPVFRRDDNLINEKTNSNREVRIEIGISDSDIIILTVGRMNRQKGYSYIIPAIPHILKKHPNACFVWVGEGEDLSKLKLFLKEYDIKDRVNFLGYRNDIPRLLMASDLFLFPSLYEGGSSIALTEAMAFGLPIVASDASGIPEVVEDNVHGVLFKKADSCSLLVALDWALEHPEKMKEMALNANMRVKEFSSETMTDKTLRLIELM